MEQYQQMTRSSARSVFELIIRRWYWLLIFAALLALLFLYFFWFRYSSTYSVSSSFIPASLGNGINVELYSSLAENEEVLDSVANSLDFETTKRELEDAISADTDVNTATVTVNVRWNNKDEALQILSALKANLEFAIVHSANAGEIKWMDSASAGAQPVTNSAQYYQFFIIGTLIGLLAGAGFSLFLGLVDKRIFNIEAVHYEGDVNVLGAVPKTRERGLNKLDSKVVVSQSRPDKQFFAVSLYLNRLLEAQDKNLIMCTSPTGECGTSTMVHNIAKVLSTIKTNILIVTLEKGVSAANEPKMHSIYPGVFEFIMYWSDTESEKALLNSFSSLLSLAVHKFRLILVDCPALLENMQISMLVEHMDATLLVCRQGKTIYDDVQAAVSILSQTGAKPVYCVWNFADKPFTQSLLPERSSGRVTGRL